MIDSEELERVRNLAYCGGWHAALDAVRDAVEEYADPGSEAEAVADAVIDRLRKRYPRPAGDPLAESENGGRK